MLVLSRRINEVIVINDDVRVTVIAVQGERVRLGIQAPRDVPVDRAELYARKVEFADEPIYAACGAVVDAGEFLSDNSIPI